MSQRHNLRVISMLNTTGHVTGTNTPYDGLDRYEARARIVKELQSRDLLISTSSHAMRLARCSRSRDVLEPLLQPQWYVRTAPLARIATHLSRTNQLRFVPEEFADDWYRWLGTCMILPNWEINRVATRQHPRLVHQSTAVVGTSCASMADCGQQLPGPGTLGGGT